jgi:hypothetical protein
MLLKSFFKWSLLSACLVWSAPVYALTIPVGELIANGGFHTSTSTSTSTFLLENWNGTGTFHGRASTNAINTNLGNQGFNGFFSSTFAVLGDTGGTTSASAAIGGAPNAGTHSLFQIFELQAILDDLAIASYDLQISFRTVFDGRHDNTATTTNPRPDRFSAQLSGPNGVALTLFSQNSLNFPSGVPAAGSANNQLVNDPFSATLLGLTPGFYTLSFTLFEDNGTGVRFTNTAAGIDNVSVIGTAHAVPVPEPSTWLLLGSGLTALALMGRRSRQK